MQQHSGIPLARPQPYTTPQRCGVCGCGAIRRHRWPPPSCSSQQPGHCSSPALLQGPKDDSAAQGALHHVSNLIPANPSRPWAPSPQHRQYTQRWKRRVKHGEHSRASQLSLKYLFLVPFGKPPTFY